MVRVARSPLLWILVVYYAISALTLVAWDARGVYTPTGDEPHYLVIADALATDNSVDVFNSYRREIDEPRWFGPGLAEPGSPLEPPSAHVVETDAGTFSWHGVGIGALTAAPASLAGVVGARVVMVVVASWGIALAWALAGRFLPSPRMRVGATLAVAVAYPLLLAGTQIYPDIAGGVLLLGVLTWWVIPAARSSSTWTLLAAVGAAAVPWLGGRFMLPGVLAVLAMLAATRKTTDLLWRVAVPAFALGGPLLIYHLLAFGSPLGPPTEGTLAFGQEFWLLLPGLLLDQNQGPVWANPVLWIALPGVVLLWRASRSAAVLWSVLFVALWIPAAAHPGMYGLGSFNGRYAWPLAILAFLPTLVGLGALARRLPRAFWAVVGLGVAFQAYLVALSVLVGGSAPGSAAGLDLYTRPPGTWLESYSAWWFPLQRLLPAWYDTSWAFAYPQNWVWLGLAIAIVLGLVLSVRQRQLLVVGGGVGAVAVLVAAVVGQPGPRLVQQVEEITVVAGRDGAGYPVVGPSHLMRTGTYAWFVDYAADSEGVVGKWELVRAADDSVVASGELMGTSGGEIRHEIPITMRALEPREFTLRIGWYADHDMSIETTGVRFAGLV